MAAIRRTGEWTYTFLDIKDNTLGNTETLCPLDNGIQFRISKCTLGALERLPLELLYMILINLDVLSLTTFRSVNGRARWTVDSLPHYCKIITNAPDLIRGCLSVGIGSWFSCRELYEKLCIAECENCGDFGGYLYIITCRRICFLCFTEETDYLPLLRKDAVRKFALGSNDLKALPSMKSVPGRYSPRGIKCRARRVLFDHVAARQAGLALYGSVEEMEQHDSKPMSKKLEQYESRRLLLRQRDDSSSRQPKHDDQFDGLSSNPKRFMGVVRAPYLDSRTGSLEWGIHCLACKPHHYNRPLHWRRQFTPESFREHLEECGEIIQGKHMKGTKRQQLN